MKKKNGFDRLKLVISVFAVCMLVTMPVYAAVRTIGDVYDEGDNHVDIKDALLLSSFLYGEASLDQTGQNLADTNRDGSIDAEDIKTITDYVVGNISELPELDIEADNLFTMSSASGKTGDQVTLSLNLGGNVNLCAYQVVVNYDSTALEYVDMTAGDSVLSNHIVARSEIRASYINSDDQNETEARNILNITFNIIGTGGTAAVDITKCDAWAADESKLPTNSVGGQVSIG